jgi:hypothetical protein
MMMLYFLVLIRQLVRGRSQSEGQRMWGEDGVRWKEERRGLDISYVFSS